MAAFEQSIVDFFEYIPHYYGCQVDMAIALCDDPEADLTQASWSLSQFKLLRAAYRHQGDRLMLEGPGFYYEMSAAKLCLFEQKGRHQFEFTEAYHGQTLRLTRITFLVD